MDFEEKTKKETLSIADPIMDDLMAASTEIDYKQHVKTFKTNRSNCNS